MSLILSLENKLLMATVKTIFIRQIKHERATLGFKLSRRRMGRFMAQLHRRCITKHKFKVATRAQQAAFRAPHRLNQNVTLS